MLSFRYKSEGRPSLIVLLDFMVQHLQVVLNSKLLLNLSSLLHGLRALLLLYFQEFFDLLDHSWVKMQTLAHQRNIIARDFSPLGVGSLFWLFYIVGGLVLELSLRLRAGESVG